MVADAGFGHSTILKSAFMMNNFALPKSALMYPMLAHAVLETAMAPGKRLDLVVAADIGRMAEIAFAEPGRCGRQEIDLVAESLTMLEVAHCLAEGIGTLVTVRHLSEQDALAAGAHPGVVRNQRWCSEEGYRVDIARAALRGIVPETLSAWAARHCYRLAYAVRRPSGFVRLMSIPAWRLSQVRWRCDDQ